MLWFYYLALVILPVYIFWLGFMVFASEKLWRKKEADREVCRLEYTPFPKYRICYCIAWLVITGGQAWSNYRMLQVFKTVRYEYTLKGYVVFAAVFALSLVQTLFQYFRYPHTYITDRAVYMGGNIYHAENYTYALDKDTLSLSRGRSRLVKNIAVAPGERERAELILRTYYRRTGAEDTDTTGAGE